jgi:glycosyltransferase involved in cell wall biosynthesis
MSQTLRITYLFESTTLWGGNKVALEQAELLSEAGHRVIILSKDTGPTWYPLRLPVQTFTHFDAATIPESDIIIGTYWPTVKAAYESGKGLAVHLCQGYEGSFKELLDIKAAIDEVYMYRIPKLTVSPHINRFLSERFDAETYYIGQMADNNIFYPATTKKEVVQHIKVLVIGPFDVDFKNVATSLRGFRLGREKYRIPMQLIRVSQFPLTHEEKALIAPDEYHFYVPYHSMGELYRSADIFISMSKEAEGFGLPALEAMACGVPAILSGISSYRSFDEMQDYALFADPPTPEMVALAIKRVASETSLRRHLIERGIVVAGQFTKEKVLQRLTDAFRKILHGT